MKHKCKIHLLVFCIVIFIQSLHAHVDHNEDPHYEWFEESQVAVKEDGIYGDSNKGMTKLNVIEYDVINNRYKVQCNCLNMPYYDLTNALYLPCQ